MRNIDKIIVHCAATKPSMDIGVKEIRNWHLDRGWSDVGYHYIIRRNGKIEKGRSIDVVGAHARGHNKNSIGICLVGGVNENGKADDNFAIIQYQKLIMLIDFLAITFPGSEILGHRDLPGVTKECPCFDIKAWFKFETKSYTEA